MSLFLLIYSKENLDVYYLGSSTQVKLLQTVCAFSCLCTFTCFFRKRKFDVQSFGSGTQVKLPGSSANRPNVYPFDWKYADIYDDLKKKDKYLLVCYICFKMYYTLFYVHNLCSHQSFFSQ